MVGLFGVFNFSLMLKEMEDADLSFPKRCAISVIICQVVGSALIVTNVYGLGWLGAGYWAYSRYSQSLSTIHSASSRNRGRYTNFKLHSNM
jgi:hypothetical protein